MSSERIEAAFLTTPNRGKSAQCFQALAPAGTGRDERVGARQ